MRETLNVMRASYFGPRILSFDRDGAEAYARVVQRARANGYHVEIADGQIAAVAEVNGFSVATRDARPLEAAWVKTIDPWVD